ncbi:aldehyde dehydrogenase (NADP(+)) [uncultured Friedmanniella sp.]|uniref:aldehyde dehydrogenase (NADP(+)) n=1 Tax=uncultured Friedmanniella sp. TaxID=335381 RepID=UPI0035CAA23E
MTAVVGVDPSTGQELPSVVEESDRAEVASIVAAASAAFNAYAATSRAERAALADACADEIEASGDELIATASRETGFTTAKLTGEVKRAAYQFRFFASVLRDGGYLEAAIDHAGATPMGPQPDLRRLLVPLGPVAVFGSSNFPFAFSVLGGDTASALAAGNPVVVKAHSSHPATSRLSSEVLVRAVRRQTAPEGTVGIVYGFQAGLDLVRDPAIRAVGFTGSLRGGQALLAATRERDEPIPFYGELSSLNPVVVTPAAAAERAADIGTGFAASVSVGAGQLCTKPGFLLVPQGAEGDQLVASVAEALTGTADFVLLNEGIHRTFVQTTEEFRERGDVSTVVGAPSAGPGFAAAATIFEVGLDDLDDHLVQEVFGPVAVVVRYPADQLVDAATRVLRTFPASLTTTLHVAAEEDPGPVATLTATAVSQSGRVVFNGYPTGVAVSWAQTHGGPWPSTNSVHTSVGATAIRRFLRPVTFQDAPAFALPLELQEEYRDIPRRVDGELVLP